MSEGSRPVVVGVDGSDRATVAIAWAVEAAARRGATVRLVMAQDMAAPASEAGWALGGLDDLMRDSAARILDEAAASAREVRPDVTVETQTVLGNPAQVLLDASRDASLVVVGTRGAGGFGGLLLGSVAVAVASHAECPVVVVPRGCAGRELGHGPVVVGVDGSAPSRRAAEFALAQAELLGVAVVALHSWTLAFYGGVVPTEEGTEAYAAMRDQLDTVMERSLADAVAAHPGVQVERRVVRGTSVDALGQASEGASLVVVGSRGRGGFRGMLLGSTSRQLLQVSHAPVVVIRSRER